MNIETVLETAPDRRDCGNLQGTSRPNNRSGDLLTVSNLWYNACMSDTGSIDSPQ